MSFRPRQRVEGSWVKRVKGLGSGVWDVMFRP